ncbi:MAG: protein kinase [Verrucomicrobia bacterium]|nr:protein kinase [Verrucomicrobiota bacterium]
MDLNNYKLIRSLGKGGMGEVFIAYDNICQRHVALKRIREDLKKFKSIQRRFLREAHIAAKLTHPSIIPIFSISEQSDVYYTMPYVEGETLKQILKSSDPAPISSLMRIFLNICQAVAYCHSRRILHRDLKPENIIVGKFGEVLILDWGLAEYIDQPEKESENEEIPSSPHLTRPGKVVGTLAYLAPERVQSEPASEQTDLYALGVILYQILTLKLPFKRIDLESFQKMWSYEELIDPIEAAPYRDIPHALNQIVKKCLQPMKELRYKHVSDMIADVESFMEGRPEWVPVQELKIERKEDWEFQENVLLAKHIAITRSTEVMEWVNLMISQASFSGNTKIEAFIRLGQNSSGIGFLLNVPEASERHDLMDGYCVWIGSQQDPGCKLFRCNIEVMEASDVFLQPEIWHLIRIEKTDSHLHVFVDDVLRCHYISHTPLGGTHIGLLLRDADLELSHLKVFIGSQNVTVSCLAIPDAFLADKDYGKALSEYRRIAISFPGRTEGREALFRAGVTLLEAGLASIKPKGRAQLLSAALEEFGKLHTTAGAPLEYLGKSLVYKAMGEKEEEAKCLELAIRKYPQHPLFPRLVEHVIFRLHESSSHDRLSAYYFALLTLLHLPQIYAIPDHQKLINSMRDNWETLPFFNPDALAVQLAFLLARPIPLLEMIEMGPDIEDAFYALLELGCYKLVKENPRLAEFPEIQTAASAQEKKVSFKGSPRLLHYLFQNALDTGHARDILPYVQDDVLRLWALLFTDGWEEAGKIFEKYTFEQLSSETSPLFPLYGCYLWATEGQDIAKAHFSAVLEMPYPRTSSLLGLFLARKIDLKKGWIEHALLWEKMQLYRQLALFYHCAGKKKESDRFLKDLKKLKQERLLLN